MNKVYLSIGRHGKWKYDDRDLPWVLSSREDDVKNVYLNIV